MSDIPCAGLTKEPPESRVVLRFYIAGALFALLSLSTFKFQ